MNSLLPSTLTASEARSNMYDMLEQTTTYLRRFIITHKGKPSAVLMPIEDLESLEETTEITSSKSLMKLLKQAEKDRKAKRTISLSEIKKSLK